VFKHALVQDAAYATLLRAKRRDLHARVVWVLENILPDATMAQPEVLAHHCAQADMIEKAVGYWGKAGRQAIARSAAVEAAGHLRRALELLPALADTPMRWRCELDLQTALGTALSSSKGYTVLETGQVYDRARVLCEQLGDTSKLVPIASGQCMYHLMRAEIDAAYGIAADMLRRAKREHSLEARLAAHRLSGITVLFTGRLRQARRHFGIAASILDRAGEGAAQMAGGKGSFVGIPTYRALLLLLLGHYDQAKTQTAISLAEARRLERPHLLAVALAMAAWLQLLPGKNAPHHLIKTLGELATEKGFPYWLTEKSLHQGLVLIRAGEIREGIAHVREGAARYDALGATWHAPIALCLAAGLAGSVEGWALIDEASARLEQTGVRFFDAEVRRVKGALLAEEGDAAAAEAQFIEGIGIARAQGAKHWELRIVSSLAQLWRDQGKCTEARELLAPVYNWFTEDLEIPDLRRAKALLNQME
jgi:predicted ATPase